MVSSENQAARYRAYSNYLIALWMLIRQEYPDKRILAEKIVSLNGFNRIKGGKVLDYGELKKSMRLSWYTELLLKEEINHIDLLPYAIPWSMVQSYYAIYPMFRAYFNATGRIVRESHSKTLNTIASDLIACKDRFPSPWCCVLDNDTKKQPHHLQNIDPPIKITLTNPLSSPYTNDPWQYFGLFLKTTRSRNIDNRISMWKRRNDRGRILCNERRELINKIPPTTIFDTLYRIRSRANYQDIDSFAFTKVEESDSVELQRAIYLIVSSTLMIFECIILKAIGTNRYESIVNEFSSTPIGKPANETVVSRHKVTLNAIEMKSST